MDESNSEKNETSTTPHAAAEGNAGRLGGVDESSSNNDNANNKSSVPSIMETSYLIPLTVFSIAFLLIKVVLKQSFLVSYVLSCVFGWFGEVIRERTYFYSREKVETIIGVLVYTVPIVILQKVYQVSMDVLFFPVTAYFKSRGLRIRKVEETPDMQRRKQTASVLLFMSLIPLTGVVWITILYLCYTGSIFAPVVVIYLVWALGFDRSHVTGSRTPRLRNSNKSPFRHFIDYFPITFTRTDPSTAPPSPEENYVFAYHPHGIIGLGAFGSFAATAKLFSAQYPGLDIRLLTLHTNFHVPFLREILLYSGVCSVARYSCDTILKRGPGSSICIVVGGASEALETKKGTYRIILNRKGFVRVAVENKANLIPVIGFGETDAFETLHTTDGSFLRKLQNVFQEKMGFSVPIFWGRGLFNYDFGFMPKRRPIHVICGNPIYVRDFKETGEELVDAVHGEYVARLKELFEKHQDEMKQKGIQFRDEDGLRIIEKKKSTKLKDA